MTPSAESASASATTLRSRAKRKNAWLGYSDGWLNALARQERPRILVITILLLMVTGGAWASWVPLARVVRGEGRIVPSAHSQTVQHLEGGIVAQIAVREGDLVHAGQILFRINDIQATTLLNDSAVKVRSLKARAARLQAEASGATAVSIPADLVATSPEMQAELSSFDADRASLAQSAAVLSAQLMQRQALLKEAQAKLANVEAAHVIAWKQKQILEGLEAKSAASHIEVLDAQAKEQALSGSLAEVRASIPRLIGAVREGQAEVDELQLKAQAAARLQLAETETELSQGRGEVQNQSDRLDRTAVRAPVRAIVNHLYVDTVGGVVRPGDPLAELTPADGDLIVEAKIRPSDRGELHVGLPAKVKITAYDYAIFGALDGTLTEISADTLPEESGERFYRVKVRVARAGFAAQGKPMYPGMTANVDIVVGQRTMLQYVLSPVTHFYSSAFREAR